MRIGIFGGSFDPVHVGHLILAEQAREQAELDEVWFMPAARAPHKQDRPQANFDHRAEMLTMATSGHPNFRVSLVEGERPAPSYTVDTLDYLCKSRPDASFLLILGGDSIRDFPNWREPRRILAMAGLLVVPRHGSAPPDVAEFRETVGLTSDQPLEYRAIEVPFVTISSTDLRNRLASGRSIRYMTPRAVETYAVEKKLYR